MQLIRTVYDGRRHGIAPQLQRADAAAGSGHKGDQAWRGKAHSHRAIALPAVLRRAMMA
jgi:hypothetical protein